MLITLICDHSCSFINKHLPGSQLLVSSWAIRPIEKSNDIHPANEYNFQANEGRQTVTERLCNSLKGQFAHTEVFFLSFMQRLGSVKCIHLCIH